MNNRLHAVTYLLQQVSIISKFINRFYIIHDSVNDLLHELEPC